MYSAAISHVRESTKRPTLSFRHFDQTPPAIKIIKRSSLFHLTIHSLLPLNACNLKLQQSSLYEITPIWILDSTCCKTPALWKPQPQWLPLCSKVKGIHFQNDSNVSQPQLHGKETTENVKTCPTDLSELRGKDLTLGETEAVYRKKRRSDSRSEGGLWMLSPTR